MHREIESRLSLSLDVDQRAAQSAHGISLSYVSKPTTPVLVRTASMHHMPRLTFEQ